MKNKIYDNLFTEYYSEFEREAAELGYYPADDFEKVYELMDDDLMNKGFSVEELEDNCIDDPDDINFMYKFIAYRLLTHREFYDEQSLRKVLKEVGILDDNITNEDIKNILIQKDNITL